MNRNKKTVFRNGKQCQKVRTTDKPRKDKIHDSGKEKQFKANKIRTFENKKLQIERAENFKYLGVILNEYNNNQIDLQERIKNANKTYFMLQNFFKNKIKIKEHNNRQNVNICIRHLETNRDRKQMNIF
jgi:hypothetical protein